LDVVSGTLDVFIGISVFATGILSSFGVLTLLMKNKTARAMVSASWVELSNAVFKKRTEQLVALESEQKEMVQSIGLIDNRVSGIEQKVSLLDEQTDFHRKQYEQTYKSMQEQFEIIKKRLDASDEMNKTQMKMIDTVIDLVKK